VIHGSVKPLQVQLRSQTPHAPPTVFPLEVEPDDELEVDDPDEDDDVLPLEVEPDELEVEPDELEVEPDVLPLVEPDDEPPFFPSSSSSLALAGPSSKPLPPGRGWDDASSPAPAPVGSVLESAAPAAQALPKRSATRTTERAGRTRPLTAASCGIFLAVHR
jgi:hypothetical protein